MTILCVLFAGLVIFLFDLCNNVTEKCLPNIAFCHDRKYICKNKRKKLQNISLHYIYLYNNCKRQKKHFVKNCTHHFVKTYSCSQKDILKKKYEHVRRLNGRKHKIFFFRKDIYTQSCDNDEILIKREGNGTSTNCTFHSGRKNYGGFTERGDNALYAFKKEGGVDSNEGISTAGNAEKRDSVNEEGANSEAETGDTFSNKEGKNLHGEKTGETNAFPMDVENEENFGKAIKKAEEYFKGKEDDIIEKRETDKKKKVIENLKEQEDVFSDKFLDLSMYDVLKYVYREGMYTNSKKLVNVIYTWMQNAYNRVIKGEGDGDDGNGGEINHDSADGVVERVISDDYSRERKESDFLNFIFRKTNNDKQSSDIESLKLYNRKNLGKYFFSFNRGNILKQLVTEGEDEMVDDQKKPKMYDKGDEIFDEHVQKILTNPLFHYDEDYYIDRNRYMKSNVTVEFNIYDSYNDKVILNNKKTNSTMLEFPLMYSHSIIQKCILTMKKLEKAIFYINNSFLFKKFSFDTLPTNEEDRNIYDIIINENWLKMEIYLCNIYGINEKWMGITPETFADEKSASNFLKEYSIGSSNNLIGMVPGQGVEGGERTNQGNSNAGVSNGVSSGVSSGESSSGKSSSGESNSGKSNSGESSSGESNSGKSNSGGSSSSGSGNSLAAKRRAEIARRTEEYETKKELEIKTDFLMKKLENEMKYDPNHYMWQDLYPQLDEHQKKKTDAYFDSFKKEMSENKFSRGYTDNIKKKQSLKGYDIGEKIEGRAKYYIWQETIHGFSLYFPLRPYIKKKDIIIDIDNTFFFLSISNHTIVKDFFTNPINSSDSIWSLSDNEHTNVIPSPTSKKKDKQFPIYEIVQSDERDMNKIVKEKYCLIYNIYKDNNHKYMWGSIFKSS
ncbi:conserved Plasmodium protein, unknown function [Plasmodium ovale wallikeri]|uniref:CS domain-containing protein n=2 Tax=Plasmodium ovale TaxID=36330 RepID=A0A1A8YTK2_PLAOA|nr:conserved Plasmodium protein, unknown function [Plasmodium ovale wallikeri]SBT34846.1 conserved Plasmodium protein, unknown function [Plasmodium ovale wallikeri]SBT76807.1 conserved Plasmodium protein, unknown function [Plasmodium ovale]